jgi:hypothetical protein
VATTAKNSSFGLQAVINGAAPGVGRLAAQFAPKIKVSEKADITDLDASLQAMSGEHPNNSVETAIDRLVEEGRSAIA